MSYEANWIVCGTLKLLITKCTCTTYIYWTHANLYDILQFAACMKYVSTLKLLNPLVNRITLLYYARI